jgi:MFS family permease
MVSTTKANKSSVALSPLDQDSIAEAGGEKVATALTVPLPPNSPDGGTRAWLQVAGSFIVFGNLWGMTFAFGTFQSYYELTYLTSTDASTISWIGTICTFLLILGGVASGPLFDWGYFRSMLLVGALVETLSVFLLSLCSEYYQILLTQGIMAGLGNGLLYIPGLALVGRAFKKHRAIAMGITTCGIIYTLTFERLIGQMSFGWTVRIMGFIMLASYCVAFPLVLWKADVGDISSGQARKLFDKSAFRDLPFWTYTTSNFLIFCGYMVPFYYMASYGQIELGMDRRCQLRYCLRASGFYRRKTRSVFCGGKSWGHDSVDHLRHQQRYLLHRVDWREDSRSFHCLRGTVWVL